MSSYLNYWFQAFEFSLTHLSDLAMNIIWLMFQAFEFFPTHLSDLAVYIIGLVKLLIGRTNTAIQLETKNNINLYKA